MKTWCEFCGVDYDLDEMYMATITSSNGNETRVTICDECAHSNKHILTDIVKIGDVDKELI